MMGQPMRFFRKTLWLASACVLIGCDVAQISNPISDLTPGAKTGVSQTVLSGLTIQAPSGYCIDRRENTRNFRLLAACNLINDDPAAPLVEPAVLTVTIAGTNRDGTLPDAADIADSVGLPVTSSKTEDGMVLVQLEGGSQRVFEAADTRQWRGMFVIDGRNIGLALYAPKGSVYAGQAGASMLQRLRSGISIATE